MNDRYWTARCWHDWEPIYNRKAHWNWVDFTVVSLTVEHADYESPHVWEIQLGLLGLHVEFIRVDRHKVRAWDERIEEIHKELRCRGTEDRP